MATTEIVKSSFIVDPEDKFNLIRRTESGADLDREYWERVNQGDNVSNVAKMFEGSPNTSEQIQREQIRVGKIKRDSFLENFVKNEENYKDQIKTGKLKVDELFPVNKTDESYRPEIRVGKLKTKDIFSNKENEDLDMGMDMAKPKMKIGKLDPKHMFDSSNKERENEKEMFNSIVIGKLNTKNLFENSEKEDVEKPSIKVGKINAKDLFCETNEAAIPKSSISVGKLKIKEEDLFENKDENDKPMLPVGKLNTTDIFSNSPTEEKSDVKFYKPTVQPKKIKVQNLFQESGENQNSQRQEIKVGKVDATAFLQNASENTETPKQSLRVGKLDTTKLFVPVEVEEEVEEEPKSVIVGKINLGQIFQSGEKEEEQKKEIRVGKLKQNIYNLNDSGIEIDESPEEVPKLRGARRVNKGNRISCLIENLHTDKKNYSDEENEEEDKEVEDIKLGRDRMSAIQNMFSGQESGNDSQQDKNRVSVTSPQMAGLKEKFMGNPEKSISSTNFNEFDDLKDEGLVSTNLERFATGKVLGSQTGMRKSSMETNFIDKKHIESVSARFEESASKSNQAQQNTTNHVPRKLKDAENIFQHNKEDYTDCVRVEVKVGKIDAENIFKPNAHETESTEEAAVKVGKLKKADSMFNSQTNDDTCVKREVRVGKIDAENIFKPNDKDNNEDKRSQLRVGKLSKDVFNPQNEQSPEQKVDFKVGKISTKDLFQKAEENSEELLSIVKVGKLSEDKLYLTSNAGDNQENKKDIDTDIVPAGKVSERANAFLHSKKNEPTPAKTPCPTVKRSESTLAADMQKKYQEQIQSGSLKRNKSQKSVDKKENTQVVVESGKMQDARNSFFQSMMTCSSSQSSSAQRLGTSIMPAGSCENWKVLESSSESKSNEVRTTSSKKGKALFQRCAEQQEEEEVKSLVDTSQVLPGVDLEEIEDEFERLHREMMGDSD